jgi:crotonobetaine/carnitine-CoA ligase
MVTQPHPPSRVLGEWLREEAALDPDREFVQCASDWMTLGELDRRSDRVAAALQALGVRKGDRVAVNLPNRIEYVVLIYAIAKTGAIQLPLNTYLRGEFLRHQLAQTEPTLYLTDEAGVKMLEPVLPQLLTPPKVMQIDDGCYSSLESSTAELTPVEMSPNDVCVIIYTSGTTGPSKGCTITHGYYCNLINVFIDHGW